MLKTRAFLTQVTVCLVSISPVTIGPRSNKIPCVWRLWRVMYERKKAKSNLISSKVADIIKNKRWWCCNIFIHCWIFLIKANFESTIGKSKVYIVRSISPVVFRVLTHFSPISHFYTPWKRQKTIGFVIFSGGIEIWYWTKMG